MVTDVWPWSPNPPARSLAAGSAETLSANGVNDLTGHPVVKATLA
jgi:hypothetical protein